MKKNEYLSKLNQALEDLPYTVRVDLMRDYEEHFAVGLEQGRTEEEIAESLGDPYLIAREFKSQTRYASNRSKQPTFNVLRAIGMTFVLGLMNCIFVLGPYLAVAGIILGFWGIALGLGLSGIAAIGLMLFSIISFAHRYLMDMGLSFMTIVSGSVFCSSLGVLFGIGCWYASKAFVSLTVKYVSWNFKTIIGRRF